MSAVITATHLSKAFRTGTIGYGATLYSRLGSLLGGGPADDGKRLHWALKDLSFTLAPGEVVGVLGHNGSGKSTLMKLLARITPPTEGRIEIQGRIGALIEIGMGFHPELTGRENIQFSGVLLGMSKAEIAAATPEIIAFADIGDYLDEPVKRYSSGMFMRLAFAVSAHMDAEILLIDEVLAVGDAGFQLKCLERLRWLTASGGRSVLFVSHDMGAVEALCHRAMVLDHGQKVFDGDTAGAIAEYRARQGLA